MPKPVIFISYRREDSGGYAGRLYDRLRQRFGSSQVFMDIDTIEPGVDFVEVIKNAISSCNILLVVIGKQWPTVIDAQGQRRLDNPHDFVRLEIGTALRQGILVIPVLVGGASMPEAPYLPDDLVALARRNALEISNERFNYDLDRLIKAIYRAVGISNHRISYRIVAMMAVICAVAVLAWFVRDRTIPHPSAITSALSLTSTPARLAMEVTATLSVPLSATPMTAPTSRVMPIATMIPSSTNTLTPQLSTPSPTLIETDGMEMVNVPAGEFLMGSTEADQDADNSEKPQHTVYVDAFWIDRTEVTNATFARFVAEAGYETEAEKADQSLVFDPETKNMIMVTGADWRHPRGPRSTLLGLERHPVVHISWKDATAYCTWAGERLPTEAEWEKAARGTDGLIYPWGNQRVDGNLLNFADRNLDVEYADRNIDDHYQFTAPVGSYPDGASPYGALDMAGNVWEWTSSLYRQYPFRGDDGREDPNSTDFRVMRGGAWRVGQSLNRAANRGPSDPTIMTDSRGFRCVRSS